ncbi:MAG: hypothetical protein HFG13_04575 [Oscillibacter sp.]|nr:hypothetical protein [Oscillibacter sp.]
MDRRTDTGWLYSASADSSSAKIGCGTAVCVQAVIGAGANIGRGCIISSGAAVDRDMIPDGINVGCGQAITSNIQIVRGGSAIWIIGSFCHLQRCTSRYL